MTTTVYDVLDELRKAATSEADKGSKLERQMEQFLRTNAVYADQFSDVYLSATGDASLRHAQHRHGGRRQAVG